MRQFTSFLLFFIIFMPPSQAADHSSAYVEITINGLEEVAPPLNRLADAVETLSQSDKLSPEDQHKIIAIIDEMKLLTDKLDHSIETAKQKVSQTQEEISASIRQMIILALLGLVATVGIIFAAIFILFRIQILPLVNSTSSSLDKFSDAMNNLSTATKIINEHNEKTGHQQDSNNSNISSYSTSQATSEHIENGRDIDRPK